ncbi:MAG: hydroxymethylbilane synthase [Bdellovibrionales bacterium]
MRLKIASRKSDLARLQAYMVGDALQKAHPGLEIEYQFRASLGDINLTDPLWKMPEKGVFTQDFLKDLLEDKCDLVVHSWKDLPIEKHPDTEIAATLARADSRDLLLVRKDLWEEVAKYRHFRVYSSSPRREYNLTPFLKKHLPTPLEKVQFLPVRGNVQTRVEKLFSSEDVAGLVLAKAALDRLLTTEREEFAQTRHQLQKRLSECYWMVLPLSQNPTAAAQGALALEIHSTRDDVRNLLKPIHQASNFSDVEKERQILSSYGGGCHQKIGVSVSHKSYGSVLSLRGLTDAGIVLKNYGLEQRELKKIPASECWPSPQEKSQWFEREAVDTSQKETFGCGLWVARTQALPREWAVSFDQPVWTSGVETWAKLAERGVWVNGTADGLGEQEAMGLEALAPKLQWCKLTHDDAAGEDSSSKKVFGTYRLKESLRPPRLENKKYFYWMSGSAFKRALSLNPHIASLNHACGPGNTYRQLKELLPQAQIDVFLSQREWYEALTGEAYE